MIGQIVDYARRGVDSIRQRGVSTTVFFALREFYRSRAVKRTASKIGLRLARIDVLYEAYLSVMRDLTRRLASHSESKIKTEDWDYLIVLDGCRYDTFEAVSDLDGRLLKYDSRCGGTKEWLIDSFGDGDWSDTIYISGSAWLTDEAMDDRFGGDPFKSVDKVWDYGWDTELGTCPADIVWKAATNAVADDPDARVVVHFEQPHTPFIGDVDLSYEGKDAEMLDDHRDVSRVHYHEWQALRNGDLTREEVQQGYRANLGYVLEEVEKLLPVLDGKVVVTSDHGNAMGELCLFGHPGPLTPETSEVPWLEIDAERTREPERHDIDRSSDEDLTPDDRLRALGYKR
jgi:hypothetical protein